MSPERPSAAWRLWSTLYRAEVVLALLFAEPLRIAARGPWYREMLLRRMGVYPGEARQGALWIHAPTVGELQVASALAKALPPDLPLLVTVFHEHGWSLKLAQQMFDGRATVAYPPLMLAGANRRFLRHFSPRAFILIESQPWPLAGLGLADARIPMAIVNANVALRTRPILAHRLVRPLLPRLTRVCVRTEEDARGYRELGVAEDRVVVTGNLKFDLPDLDPQEELKGWIREQAGGRPILVAGSVHSVAEAREVIAAFERIGGGERALLLLAPRLVPTLGDIAGVLAARGLSTIRRSSLPAAAARPAVLLLDSLGELPSLYEIADAAFIGGTLAARGGHNPAEAARFAVPVAAGPNMEQFLSIAEMFDQAGAWRRVASAGELAEAWDLWLREPAAARGQGRRGQELVERSRGARGRTLAALEPLLDAVRRGA